MSQDSDSDQEFDIESINEDIREHVREVLAKGKEIAPYYSDTVLYNLFRRYFQVENVFYNQLRMTNSRRNTHNETEEGWTTVGKEKKGRTRSGKYNFLDDKQLIWRANNWDKDEAKDRGNRKPRAQAQGKDEQENKSGKYTEQRNSRQDQRKQQKKQNKYKEKKQSREESQADQKAINTATKRYAQNLSTSRQPQQPEKKKTRYAEKTATNEVKKQQTKEENSGNAPVSTIVNDSKTTGQPKSDSELTFVEKKGQSESQCTKNEKNEKIHSEVSPKNTQIVQQAVKKPQYVAKQAPPATSQGAKVNLEQQGPVKLTPEQIEANFQNSLRQNSKMLKFIKPAEKKQAVSYIWNNGSIDSVKVLVPLV